MPQQYEDYGTPTFYPGMPATQFNASTAARQGNLERAQKEQAFARAMRPKPEPAGVASAGYSNGYDWTQTPQVPPTASPTLAAPEARPNFIVDTVTNPRPSPENYGSVEEHAAALQSWRDKTSPPTNVMSYTDAAGNTITRQGTYSNAQIRDTADREKVAHAAAYDAAKQSQIDYLKSGAPWTVDAMNRGFAGDANTRMNNLAGARVNVMGSEAEQGYANARQVMPAVARGLNANADSTLAMIPPNVAGGFATADRTRSEAEGNRTNAQIARDMAPGQVEALRIQNQLAPRVLDVAQDRNNTAALQNVYKTLVGGLSGSLREWSAASKGAKDQMASGGQQGMSDLDEMDKIGKIAKQYGITPQEAQKLVDSRRAAVAQQQQAAAQAAEERAMMQRAMQRSMEARGIGTPTQPSSVSGTPRVPIYPNERDRLMIGQP